MRRTITFVLIIFLILGFTCACNNSYEFTENSEESDIIFKFETKLNENNIVYDRTTLTSNELGAKDCYYYYIEENNPLIVYVFDENNEKREKTEKLEKTMDALRQKFGKDIIKG